MYKNCKTCGSRIYESAKKCPQCNTFQDWRRNINFSTLVLSLLVSLFAVLGVLAASIPKLYAFFKPPNSEIKIEQVKDIPSIINLEVFNELYYNSGEELVVQLKSVFPSNEESNLSSTTFDNGIFNIAYGQKSMLYFLDSIEKKISYDSRYFLHSRKTVYTLELKYLIRNTGKRDGVLGYLKLNTPLDTMLYNHSEFKIVPHLYVSDHTNKNIELTGKIKLSANYFDIHNLNFTDTIHEYFFYENCDEAFFFSDENELNVSDSSSIFFEALILNFRDKEVKSRHNFKIQWNAKYTNNKPVYSCEEVNQN